MLERKCHSSQRTIDRSHTAFYWKCSETIVTDQQTILRIKLTRQVNQTSSEGGPRTKKLFCTKLHELDSTQLTRHMGARRHGQEGALAPPPLEMHCKTLSRRIIYALFSQPFVGFWWRLRPQTSTGIPSLGPRWGTFVPGPLICPPLKKSCGRPQAATTLQLVLNLSLNCDQQTYNRQLLNITQWTSSTYNTRSSFWH